MESHKEAHRDSREQLIEAARKVFAEKGFDGATVKELAEKARVNISLVSYYFGGKEGLYKACIEQTGRGRLEVAERILKEPSSVEDFKVRLTLFIEDFFDFNFREKDFCSILDRECFSKMLITRDVFRETFLKAAEKLSQFFISAQRLGILRSEVDPEILHYLFFGAIKSAVHFAPLMQEFYGKSMESDRTFRDAVVKHAVDYLVGGFLHPKHQQHLNSQNSTPSPFASPQSKRRK
jgi:AcrR family transcriptional regulator